MNKSYLSLLVFTIFLLLGKSMLGQCPSIKPVAISVNHVSCNSGSDGTINLNVTDGTPPYSYNWTGPDSFTSNDEDLSGIVAGTYHVTVEDANNCTGIDSFIIIEPGAFVYNAALTNASCFGSSDAVIDFSLTGGTPPYTYLWTNMQGDTLSQSQDVSGLAVGTYGVAVEDANGCTGAIFYIINEPDSMTVTADINDVSCAGEEDGAIDITTLGGTGVKSYLWSNGAQSEDLDNEGPGTYMVTVTDLNGCSVVKSFTIEEPDSLEIDFNITNVSCNGADDGSIEAIVSGGTQPYNYIWSNGDSTAIITGLAAGTYDITVTDLNGCTVVGSATVVDTNAAVTATTAVTDVSCFGLSDGSIDLTVTSGTPPFAFVWSTGDSTEDLSGLSAGSYSVTISDSVGCTLELNDIEVEEPDSIEASASITDVTCNGDSTGAIDINITGGTPPYTFDWLNGENAEDLGSLTAGEYCVVITDSALCVSDTFCFQVNEQDEIQLSPNITQPVCNRDNDGSIDVTVTGGTPPYDFIWDTGDTTSMIDSLMPGDYSLTVEDANGCTASATYTINEPDSVQVEFSSVIHVTCNGESDGSIDISVSGGTPPYTYNWSNGDTTQDLSGLNGGPYQVTVTDQNGCEDITDTVIIEEPDTFSLDAVIQDVVCPSDSNGAIDLTPVGGTPPYMYQWALGDTTEDLSMIPGGTYVVTATDSNGCTATDSFEVIDPPIDDVRIEIVRDLKCNEDTIGILCAIVDGTPPPFTYTWSTGDTSECITGVTAGVYSVTVRDDIGCFSFFNNFIFNEPDEIQLSADVTPVTCDNGNDGSIDLTVAGGKMPFSYYWSTTDTTQDLDSLEEGTYTVNVTDSNECEAQGTYTINPINPMVVNVGVTRPSCGEEDGSITITVSGGTPPFTYQWSTGDTTDYIDSVAAGIYEVTVTDASGCMETAIAVLDNLSDMAISSNVTNPVCGSPNSGAIDITVTGGASPLSYLWNTGDTTEDLSNLQPGQYLLTVTDADSCKIHLAVDLTEDSGLSLSFTNIPSSCGIYNTGSATVTVSGGSAPYTYLWSDGQITSTADSLATGIHYVTVTDSNGCEETGSVTVSDNANINITLNVQDVTCTDGNSGAITTTVSGGAAPYTFVWSDGAMDSSLTGIGAGMHSVTVTDTLGCSAAQSTTLEKPDSILAIADRLEPLCYQDTNGSVEVFVSGGTAPFEYDWSTGDTTSSITGIPTGNYVVTVEDAKGCSASTTIDLDEPDSIMVTENSIIQPECNGDSTGSLDVTITGGTTPYSYDWSNGTTTEDLNNIPAGQYCLVVADANGCLSNTFCFQVTEPDEITITPDVTEVTCNDGVDGAISVTVIGGTPPYSYEWDNGNMTDSLIGLVAGTYNITVTDSNLCEATLAVTVSEPAPFDFDNSITFDATCDTAFNGSIEVNVTGGTSPYNYMWDDQTTGPTRDSLGVGSYQVTVIDDNGCIDSATFNINSMPCNNPPEAQPDTAQIFTCADEPVVIPVLANDFDPDGDSLFIQAIFDGPRDGGVSISTYHQILIYVPFEDFVGIDTFFYIVADVGLPPQLTDTAMVIITVLPCRPNVFVPNGFSPNGDDVNDFFEIVDIDFFPDNELIIFNRWGNKVIEFNGYNNEWQGKNEDGEELPDGTYYYVLQLNDDMGTAFTGYVVIHR